MNNVFERGDFQKGFYLFEDSALIGGDLGENDIMQTIRVYGLNQAKKKFMEISHIKIILMVNLLVSLKIR